MREIKEKFYDLIWNLQDKWHDPKNAMIVGAIGGLAVGYFLGRP